MKTKIPFIVMMLTGAALVHAASPQLTRILPRGAQRGTELELTFDGARLADAQEVLIYQPGVTVTKLTQPTDKSAAGKQFKALVKVAPDARIGEYSMRVRTATGISELRTFYVGVYPVTRLYGSRHQEGVYTTLMMSTGLTFGTISALFGLTNGIIDQAQYSALVAAVIGSAVIPTLIANAFFLPRHLLPKHAEAIQEDA